ncbi:hypothetical protein SFBSU_006G445 [Candidatus Arthromitus sp. SFB-mouse-SU]|nr:hypothetical protein SFBNYU_008600 [Candidatus Arthromitus sp. SFB-mouse-NYU]EIA22917.1 hypothetical protein SFB1_229G2 [Candidatus Arthromitus sp. SFB-1]EIA25214.1 hypothetical protein SFB2_031G1 [Candidatus Arthromitus sp. SFB-2]EIA27025.1 hypothetical protein SFB5_220G18 [Candidatus Arthromitus sp. SFB-5]EIA28458.1 hypothetical protein SFB6_046G18 [Candidatus Arthromitus sp. SFB-co]EIA30764.1 hypothetical protein SFBSU_006G445 [Candidatus Arthromitus sp. SFB-mouse-SU]EIA31597.1 hypothet
MLLGIRSPIVLCNLIEISIFKMIVKELILIYNVLK